MVFVRALSTIDHIQDRAREKESEKREREEKDSPLKLGLLSSFS